MFTFARLATLAQLRRFMRDESGATALEYALIASGVAAAIATVCFSLGTTVQQMFSGASAAFQ